ncbi:MAG: succinylglutamate desuccinylase/aspartoacylase family protein [bacterium]|nr:succinylglutamate desuccinylase/aspartoacylase family protein [bacterium]
MTEPFLIRDARVEPGQRKTVSLRVARLYDHTQMAIPVHVIHGKRPGPVLFVSAAIHGDEINGVEIIHRLLQQKKLANLKGTLLAIPIVNVFGFNAKSRYLPDRRDLNRSFPGSKKGSMASRLAHVFMREIVRRSNYGIDLHTGAIHRTNLPQIRACLDQPETRRLAEAFGTPVILNSDIRDGSLRGAAQERDIPILLYEGGEALRFDEATIRTGIAGIVAVMRAIEMLPPARVGGRSGKSRNTFVALSSHWVRAQRSGILRTTRKPGDRVEAGDLLGIIAGPMGERPVLLRAPETGVIVGQATLPLLNRGEAIFHIATFKDSQKVEEHIDDAREEFFAGDTNGLPG